MFCINFVFLGNRIFLKPKPKPKPKMVFILSSTSG